MCRTATTLLILIVIAAFATAQPREAQVVAPGELGRLLQRRVGTAQTAYGRRVVHEPFVEPITAAKIRAAIDDAVTWLRSQQAENGSIGGGEGETGLAALAMLAAGVDPASDAQLRKALEFLAKGKPNNTYIRAIRANVWEYALRKMPYDESLRRLLKEDFEWLLKALGDREGWRYSMESRDWDNSCTQYGVLGIWAAARAGFDPGETFWKTMSQHFRKCQNVDGGWSYTTGGSTPNMATAGLASMFLVFDMYHGRSCYSSKDPRTFTSGEAAEVLKSLERGMTWLGQSRGDKQDGYYLYGIERTGVASGRKYFGGEDWFTQGALAVLRMQQPDGGIPHGRWGGGVCNTSWRVLFLVYGGAPVAFAKLEYGDGHDWNLNPRDLANLSKELWSAYERPLNWQTVSVRAAASEFEAPILFISGSQAAKFSEEEMLRLREYVLSGGTAMAEPSDHSKAFTESMEELVRQMFPGNVYPGYTLRPLPADHEIYTALKQDWRARPRLRGVSDGSRTFFLLSEEYLSADWQMHRTDSDAFKLATNLLFYATDLGELEGKFASILPATPAAEPRKDVITVARVQHDGTGRHRRDWDAAQPCWTKFAPFATHVTGCELKELAPVTLGKDKLDGVRLLHVTGRHGLKLSPAERTALRKFVEGGGTVLVDAYAGSTAFAASARTELEQVFGKLSPLASDHLLAQGLFSGGTDLSHGIRFKLPVRQLLRSRGETTRGQKLLTVTVGNRPAVFFSEFDLSAAMAGIENYRSLGYKPDSARKIVGNIVAWVMVD